MAGTVIRFGSWYETSSHFKSESAPILGFLSALTQHAPGVYTKAWYATGSSVRQRFFAGTGSRRDDSPVLSNLPPT